MRLTWLLLAAFVLLFAVQAATSQSTDLVEGESTELREKRWFWDWIVEVVTKAFKKIVTWFEEMISNVESFFVDIGNSLKKTWADLKKGWDNFVYSVNDLMDSIAQSIRTGDSGHFLLSLANVFTGNPAGETTKKVKEDARKIEEKDQRVFSELYNNVKNPDCVKKYRDMAVNLRQFHSTKIGICRNFATGTLAKTGLFIARSLTTLAPAVISMASDLIQAPANPAALVSFGMTAVQTIAVDVVQIVDDGKKNHQRNRQLVRLGYKCMDQVNEKSNADWDRLIKYLGQCEQPQA